MTTLAIIGGVFIIFLVGGNFLSRRKDKQIEALFLQKNRLFHIYDFMLTSAHRTNIISAKDKEEFKREYEVFWNSASLSKTKELGNIFHVNPLGTNFSENSYLSVIEYDIWELKEGFTEQEYRAALEEYMAFLKGDGAGLKNFSELFLERLR